MPNDILKIAEKYLKAWDEKDIDGIAKVLDPEVHFKGPVAETRGKDKFVQASQRMFGMMKSLQVRSKFAAGNQAIFTYDFVCVDPVGICRTAELITFKGDKIAGIELFFDARPFEKFMQAQKSVPQSA